MSRNKSLICFVLSLAAVAASCLLTVTGIGKEHKGSMKNIILGLDLRGGVSITYQAVGDDPTDEAMSDTVKKLRLRAGVMSNESDAYRQGTNRIVVDIPGQSDKKKVSSELGKPGKLAFVTDYGTSNAVEQIVGTDILDAQPGYDNENGLKYVVYLTLSDAAKEKFKKVTTDFVGKQMAIVYDNQMISNPVISVPITDGKCSIEGMASYEAAEDLASMIRIGLLKVELEEMYSSVVGPRLGEKALESSLLAGVIGLLIIIVFMAIVYRIPGVAAGISLIFYVALTLLALNAFDMTLTLPGIAGIILSIGMAVDANVIIYARIREEAAQGLSIETSVRTGFKKAASAIIDGNVTTLIAAVVLMLKGSGTVKSFAQTLAIGIVISMFTAMVASRVFVTLLYRLGFKDKKYYGMEKERKAINFLGIRHICFAISLAVILAGAVVIGLNVKNKDKGKMLNYSVEFEGGISMTADFNKKYSINEFNDQIKPKIAGIIGSNDISATAVDDSNQYLIRMKTMEDEKNQELQKMLKSEFGAVDPFEETTVSATVGSEMRADAIVAVIIATICMLIYIFVRFRDMRFAFSAILALLHDILVVFVFYAVSWISVGNTFIACMLTILGYSINATIVIFDRIRENMRSMEKKESLRDIVNKSITQTLTRSIYTSLTTFIMVLMISILGVPAIREFALPLMAGIVAGAYSSVCLTGALWYVMIKKKYEKITK